MALKQYYQLLEIAPGASSEEVKRAFRSQIARYHPDKVQHLGKEFQAMAADRAADLTEAYRILSHDGRRAEYDLARGTTSGETAPSSAGSSAPYAAPPEPVSGEAPSPPTSEPHKGGQFKQERASRDEYVRKATVGRFRQALAALGGGYDESPARGFDISLVPKRGLFGKGKGARLLGRFVASVDREAVADAWTQAAKLVPADEICVFLMGTSMAPAGDLATEIGNQRRKLRSTRLTLIPIDARDWEAHMPLDAPPIAKTLLARLKSGS